MSERPEIIANGPGEPAWAPSLPGDSPVDRLDLDVHEDARDDPQPARSAAWRSVRDGAFGPEALAITGLVVAVLPLLGLTVVSRLGAAIAYDGVLPDNTIPSDTNMAMTVTRLNALLALAAVALGLVALFLGRDASRATRGMAGAAVLVGSLAAGISLLIAFAGPGPAYF